MNQIEKKSWWSRNWKWFVPVGCLSGLVLFVGSAALILSFVFGMLKSSDPYKEALSKTKAHPAVIEALGTPLEEGYFTSGSIHISGPSGKAELAIPISGPKGTGTIYLVAQKTAGEWSFSKLVVEVDKPKQRMDLLQETPAQPNPSPNDRTDAVK